MARFYFGFCFCFIFENLFFHVFVYLPTLLAKFNLACSSSKGTVIGISQNRNFFPMLPLGSTPVVTASVPAATSSSRGHHQQNNTSHLFFLLISRQESDVGELYSDSIDMFVGMIARQGLPALTASAGNLLLHTFWLSIHFIRSLVYDIYCVFYRIINNSLLNYC